MRTTVTAILHADCYLLQSGTTQDNDFNGVAVRSDGAALLVGWTNDEFVEADTTNYCSVFAGVLMTAGAESPPPTTAPVATPLPTMGTPTPQPSAQQPSAATLAPFVAAPSSCGATESFQITSDLSEIEGCFQATEESFSNPGSTAEAWTVGGDLDYEQVAVIGFADDGTGDEVGPP